MSASGYTGLKRRKQTPWSVTFGDALVSRVIAVGGIGTIVAILLVVLVLLATAIPLFQTPSITAWKEFPVPGYAHFGIDEDGLLLWGMDDSGSIEVRCLADNAVLAVFDGEHAAKVTSSHLSIDQKTLAIGLEDGSLKVAQLEFESVLLSASSLPEAVSVDREDPVRHLDGAVYHWIEGTGIRRTQLADVAWSDPKSIASAPVVALDFLPDGSTSRFSTSTQAYALAVAGGELILADIQAKKAGPLARKLTETITTAKTSLQSRSVQGVPTVLVLLNGVDQGLAVWPDGTIDRYSLAGELPELVESQSALVGGSGISCAAPLLARQCLLCGTEDGRLQGWMVTRSPNSQTLDGLRLSLAREVELGDSPILSVTSSEQTHIAATCDAAGQCSLIYVTTNHPFLSAPIELSSSPQSVSLGPTGDVIVAATADSIGLAQAEIGYPEASLSGFFGRVWYEGHEQPKYIWQSTSGSEKSEIKLSLMPLIFGTLKATVYAMLISVPLAVLAAIFTSEFLNASTRAKVKPVIELMASLPSVVLGYVAALVAAPYLQENLATVLVGLAAVPVVFVIAGNLWNLLPLDLLVRLENLRMPAMIACLPIAYLLSLVGGSIFEQVWFDGDLVRWIGSDNGPATGGWIILLTPLLTLLAVLLLVGPLADWSRNIATKNTPKSFALFGLLQTVVVGSLVLGSAWLIAALLNGLGLDLRGSLFTGYQDRNALLVGGALGFCVIPIIYTLSEDALQAVPHQLRSASLGCGATPWQTTIRIVVPAAMSGLFSAVMIGLGRAVGETMVVLMAAGNTPLMEWNPFNGFRTLSATLATELPEAARGSTHYRTLFLAALLLFLFTLMANTVAEFVRIRFRKRASQL